MWHICFKDGQESVESDLCSGRSATSRKPENVEHVRVAINKDCQPRWLSPLQPRLGALWFLTFPKTKITFEREVISDHWWDSGKYDWMADGDSNKGFAECFEQWKRCWESRVRSQDAYFEGNWGVILLWTMFLVSCIFFNKRLCFS